MKGLRLFNRLGNILGRWRNPRIQIERSCRALHELAKKGLDSDRAKIQAWRHYLAALYSAGRIGPREIARIVLEFDSILGDAGVYEIPKLKSAYKILLSTPSPSVELLEAALRVCHRLGDQPMRRKILQQICQRLAIAGDADGLLAKLVARYNEDTLAREELHEILKIFLKHRSFDENLPWKQFFLNFPESFLPPIHQVYALLDRLFEAADLAESVGDLHSALCYLNAVPGTKNALRVLDLAIKLNDSNAIIASHIKVAECLWTEGMFAEALPHFLEAGQMVRASDCHRQLGQFAIAIQLRPVIQAEWLLKIRGEVESKVRSYLTAQNYIDAARLLRSIEDASRGRPSEPALQTEADRAGHLLSDVVKTARAALNAEVHATQAKKGGEVYKRWSQFEEAAGNYLEAALQAEMACDYFTASLFFEKAGAFGQAISALDRTGQATEPNRRAELLEKGGDFFMAGLLYERVGDIDKAVAMFEEAKDFERAADLRRAQVGDKNAVFDDRLVDLLAKAARVESLVELCLEQARMLSRSSDEQARFFRRIKFFAERGLIEPKWLDLVAAELPKAEAANKAKFDKRVAEWTATATRTIQDSYLDSFGMDLGTSNSVVTLFNKKTAKPEVVEWRGRQIIPSVFAIDKEGREVVGVPESELIGKSPRAIMSRAKRKMGTDTRFKVGGQAFRAEEISARIISHARTIIGEYLRNKISETIYALASKELGLPPQSDWVTAHLNEKAPEILLNKAVITVPAYFNDTQKQATRSAATLAGITVMRLIHEPTAACIAQYTHGTKDEIVLVIDLGAGTLDLSLLEVGDGMFEVEEIEGDNKLGSSDVDEILEAYFIGELKKEKGNGGIQQGLAEKRLRQACEELKIELSSRLNWSISLPYLIGGKTFELSLQRYELERLIDPWLKRIESTCKKIKGRPYRILLIGGGSLMPAVRRCVKNVFGIEPTSGIDPLTAVARGASIQAAILAGELKDFLILDAVPFGLGIKSYIAPGKFKFDPLIIKHATIPTKRSSIYTTVEDNQSAVRIEVFQGEDPKPENNFKIGQFTLDGIPPAKAGTPHIEVTFEIDSNCLLCVTARDKATNHERQIKISDSNLLSPAQMVSLQQKFSEARTHQEHLDRIVQLTVEIAKLLRETDIKNLSALRSRFQKLLRYYETNMAQYIPTSSDNDVLLEIYRERDELESRTHLSLDRWDTLKKSAEIWQARQSGMDLLTEKIVQQLESVQNEGHNLLRRVRDGAKSVEDIVAKYRRWLSVLQALPIKPDGNAEDLAQHFLQLSRYNEALAHFRRLESHMTWSQVELGLEILARLRRREEYAKLLNEHADLIGVPTPDFVHLNRSVRLYSQSVVWIQQQACTGSGFAVGQMEVATNRHVVIKDAAGKLASPDELRVVAKDGVYKVSSIHVPANSHDDVAILRLAEKTNLVPLRLGFSELVEVGERIITLGFPAPEIGGFEENLFCNVGLVNRIRPSELCSERVLEVSVELQRGISGAPILNELGEVLGMGTFIKMRPETLQGGQVHFERSFYAIPVAILRRLRTEISEHRE